MLTLVWPPVHIDATLPGIQLKQCDSAGIAGSSGAATALGLAFLPRPVGYLELCALLQPVLDTA